MNEKRPKRRAPPERLKLEIYLRQNGRCYRTGERLPSVYHCQFDHEPPLDLRPVNDDGTDYVPAQHDPAYLFAVLPGGHKAKTNGKAVEKKHLLRADHDQGRIAKTRSLRTSHQEHLDRQAKKQCGQKRTPSGRWPRRPFARKPR